MKYTKAVICSLLLLQLEEHFLVQAVSWDDLKNDFSTNINDAARAADGLDSIRPVTDSADTMNVTLDLNLVSINDFDDTNGYIEISGFVTLKWITIYQTSEDTSDLIKPNLLWKPPVVLINSVKTYELIGHDKSVKVRYNFLTKECQWKPWVVVRAACSPDVKYYPFDKQSCAFQISVWGYTHKEVHLSSGSNEWGFLYFEENGEWKIEETSIETSIISNFSVMDFKMKLTRRPRYYVINLISPVILLGALTACTFLLPVESGERIGFSVTCFLSYVVLLNTIMDFLPSSFPVSYLSYYTFVMMIFSAAMSVVTIITVRLYHKSEQDPIPDLVMTVFKCLTFWKSYDGGQNTVKPLENTSASWDSESLSEENLSQSTDVETVTWKGIASFLDILLFLGFFGGQIFYSVAYLVPIFIN